MSAHRVLAIAASLVLLLGGMGVVFEGPLRTSRDQEPSAIPAASFATPAPIDQRPARPVWTTSAVPDGAGFESENHQLAGGRIFRAFEDSFGSPYIQAIDAKTGNTLWEQQIASEAGILVASQNVLVIAEEFAASQGQNLAHRLVGLDAQTGIQRWQVELSGAPIAATLMGDRVLVLGWDNTLDAVGIQDGRTIYSVDVGGESQSRSDLPAEIFYSYFEPGRIATIGTIVAVVLADGSVAAIDGKTGTGLWWLYRTLPGAASVVAVGNHLLIDVGGTYIPRQDGSPVPAILASATPDASGCSTELSKTQAGTRIGGITAPDYIGALYAVDPVSGTLVWSGTTELYGRFQIFPSNDGLLLDTSVRTGPNPIEGIQCFLDMKTGTITPLTDPTSIALGSFINDINNGRTLETIAVFANGQFVAYPTAQPVDSTAPLVDLSPYLSGAFRWIELYDGAIYISMGDGTLMKVALPD